MGRIKGVESLLKGRVEKDVYTVDEFRKSLKKQPLKKTKRFEESSIQQDCVKLFAYKWPELKGLLVSIPNGIHAGGELKKMPDGKMVPVAALIAKGEGKVKGASDLFLFVAKLGYHGLCLECKTPTGKLSEDQQDWSQSVTKQGYSYRIFRSVSDFDTIVSEYLH